MMQYSFFKKDRYTQNDLQAMISFLYSYPKQAEVMFYYLKKTISVEDLKAIKSVVSSRDVRNFDLYDSAVGEEFTVCFQSLFVTQKIFKANTPYILVKVDSKDCYGVLDMTDYSVELYKPYELQKIVKQWGYEIYGFTG